jgi:hypothetical protein
VQIPTHDTNELLVGRERFTRTVASTQLAWRTASGTAHRRRFSFHLSASDPIHQEPAPPIPTHSGAVVSDTKVLDQLDTAVRKE